MPWQLLRRLVPPLGLVMQRDDTAGDTQLSLEFPRTVGKPVDEPVADWMTMKPRAGRNSQPMSGRHVLVIAIAPRDAQRHPRDSARRWG